MSEDAAVPVRFRTLIDDAVLLIRDGRPEALAGDDRIAFVGDDPLRWLREDDVQLVPLPAGAWSHATAGAVDGQPGSWWVVVDLWDADGRTGYSLEGTVHEGPDGLRLTVENLHVL